MTAITEKMTLTYRHHRQDRYSVSTPPSSSPMAPPAPAMAPKIPKALPRSAGLVKVTVSVDRAAGASMAPNAPWIARRNEQHGEVRGAAPPSAEATAKPTMPMISIRLRPIRSAKSAAQQQQSAEGQRVGGHHPLPVRIGEPQVMLGRRQRDVHHRGV